MNIHMCCSVNLNEQRFATLGIYIYICLKNVNPIIQTWHAFPVLLSTHITFLLVEQCLLFMLSCVFWFWFIPKTCNCVFKLLVAVVLLIHNDKLVSQHFHSYFSISLLDVLPVVKPKLNASFRTASMTKEKKINK